MPATNGPCTSGGSAQAQDLIARLAHRTLDDPDYWAFERNDKRSHGHALFSYPAMMVPQMQGALLDDLLAVDPTVEVCYDPFGGSGTVLTECMRRGLGFIGADLNPLAVLIMTVKARPLRTATMAAAAEKVVERAKVDGEAIDVTFPGRDKWFTPEVTADLCALRRGILAHRGQDTRRFLWVCLASTVRLVSNSRTSTFKLHAYSTEDLKGRAPDPIGTFARLATAGIAQVGEHRADLLDHGRLSRGRYTGPTNVLHSDVLDQTSWPKGQLADVLMTSPPYGDNRTTVPYGQHAFLPLMWIDRNDVPGAKSLDHLLGSPYRIDVASLGGRRSRDRADTLRNLSARSDTLALAAADLQFRAGDGLDRFVSFCADLDAAIEAILPRLRPGAIQFWTLGDRHISGLPVPTCRIVAELCSSRGVEPLTTVSRRIPNNSKRMASRNDSVATMLAEEVLVLRTPAAITTATSDEGARNVTRT